MVFYFKINLLYIFIIKVVLMKACYSHVQGKVGEIYFQQLLYTSKVAQCYGPHT